MSGYIDERINKDQFLNELEEAKQSPRLIESFYEDIAREYIKRKNEKNITYYPISADGSFGLTGIVISLEDSYK